MQRQYSCGIGLLLVMVLLCCWSAAVQASLGVRMDPLLVERTVAAGSTFEYTVYIDNNSRYDRLVGGLSVADISETRLGAYQIEPPESTAYSLARWVTIQPASVNIPPGGHQQVRVRVSIPRGVHGGRYGAIVLSLGDSSSGTAGASRVDFQLASFLEISISGGSLRREAYVSAFSLQLSEEVPDVRSRVGDAGLVFAADIFNNGNVHIAAEGSLIIQTDEGRTVARYPLGGGRGVILPEATVALRSIISRNLPAGDYRARAVIDYGTARPLVSELEFRIDEAMVRAEAAGDDSATLSRFLVEPQQIERMLSPGAFEALVLEITNTGEEPVHLEGAVFPLEFNDVGAFVPESERGEAVDWIQLNPSSLVLDPGRTRRVRLSLNPPRGLEGGYYSDIVFRTVDEASVTERGVSVFAFVGSELQREGILDIADFAQTPEALLLRTAFANTGNIHLHPSVTMQLFQIHPQIEQEDGRIIQARREELADHVLPMSDQPVLPGTERLAEFFLPAALQPGAYELAVRVDYDGREPAVKRLPFDIRGGADND